VADLHSESNKHNFEITQSVLDEHGLSRYTKAHWDQLTQERLDEGDVTVCMNQAVADECTQLSFTLPAKVIVWNVPDFDEVTPIPKTEDELNNFDENTYSLVVVQVNSLVQQLKLRGKLSFNTR
jgi:protein-tyrosine-phosphatase